MGVSLKANGDENITVGDIAYKLYNEDGNEIEEYKYQDVITIDVPKEIIKNNRTYKLVKWSVNNSECKYDYYEKDYTIQNKVTLVACSQMLINTWYEDVTVDVVFKTNQYQIYTLSEITLQNIKTKEEYKCSLNEQTFKNGDKLLVEGEYTVKMNMVKSDNSNNLANIYINDNKLEVTHGEAPNYIFKNILDINSNMIIESVFNIENLKQNADISVLQADNDIVAIPFVGYKIPKKLYENNLDNTYLNSISLDGDNYVVYDAIDETRHKTTDYSYQYIPFNTNDMSSYNVNVVYKYKIWNIKSLGANIYLSETSSNPATRPYFIGKQYYCQIPTLQQTEIMEIGENRYDITNSGKRIPFIPREDTRINKINLAASGGGGVRQVKRFLSLSTGEEELDSITIPHKMKFKDLSKVVCYISACGSKYYSDIGYNVGLHISDIDNVYVYIHSTANGLFHYSTPYVKIPQKMKYSIIIIEYN